MRERSAGPEIAVLGQVFLSDAFRAGSWAGRHRSCWGAQKGCKAGLLGGRAHLPSSACRRVQRHPFERIATPFQVYSWTAPQAEHAMDCVRAEDAYTSRLGYEEHIPGQVPVARPRLPWAPPPLPWWVPGRVLCASLDAPSACLSCSLGSYEAVHGEVEEGTSQSRLWGMG